MFCDLVGSTALSERLDPEELREEVRGYQAVCAKVIGRFDGHIAQYLGDGLLVYFGYPLAHEDDAQRAACAGLGIVDAVGRLDTRFRREQGLRLSVRVGIHTGLVVVGEMGEGPRREELALGDTPNIAARMQGIAEPDTVVISEATYRLVRGFFDCRDLGAHALKGVSRPIPVYRVLHESTARSRLDVAATTGLTPLVGRDQEVALLLERWQRVVDGIGQVVWLSGEAGIGKSRLVQVLKEHVALDPQAWLTECCGSPYHKDSAFFPVIDLFERVILRFERQDSAREKLSKLEGFLVQYGFSLPEVMPLFAALLSVPLGEDYSALHLTPTRQKQKTMAALLSVLLARAAKQPVLFVVEDLHWIDPSTRELLDLILDQGPTARILTVLTFRPEFQPPWALSSHLTPLALGPLPHQQTRVMVARVTGGKRLPEEIFEQVVVKTDGIPLFVEELTKTVLESDWLREQDDRYELTGPFPPLAIPATLQDSLMARLDRLATVKEVAQLGATFGREFPYELLQAVSPLDDGTLQHSLVQLVRAGFLYQRGAAPHATYLFKHSLFRDAAYESLLKRRRQQYHVKIAQVLEARFPEIAETQPELVAHHCAAAGLGEQAISYWHRAAERANQGSAYVEAITQLHRGLELVKTLPETTERACRELDLQTALGTALRASKGYTAPEVRQAYARAHELCERVGDTPQLFRVLRGLHSFYYVRGELQTARQLAEQLLSLAQRTRDAIPRTLAHYALGAILFYQGEFVPAREQLEQGMTLYDSQDHRTSVRLFGFDTGVITLGHLAWTLWSLGYPNQALQRIDKALTLARQVSHPLTLAFALNWVINVWGCCRWSDAAYLSLMEELVELSQTQGFPYWLALGMIKRGWALAIQGYREEGCALTRKGVEDYRRMGPEVGMPRVNALHAELFVEEVGVEEGLRLVAEGLRMAHENGDRHWEAELHRVRGELLLRRGADDSQVEACFNRAIEIARRQQAKSFELRAAMSRARGLRTQGKTAKARRLLQEVYDWFTEGFDTPDLMEAEALLQELS
jgi:class 3 adenylate cyclase/predicted ATPase